MEARKPRRAHPRDSEETMTRSDLPRFGSLGLVAGFLRHDLSVKRDEREGELEGVGATNVPKKFAPWVFSLLAGSCGASKKSWLLIPRPTNKACVPEPQVCEPLKVSVTSLSFSVLSPIT